MAVEGVDQLETYFGAYLPQFFYAVLAPLTLFAVLNSISCLIYISSLSFLFTVTMIPISFVKIDDVKRPAYTLPEQFYLSDLHSFTTVSLRFGDSF